MTKKPPTKSISWLPILFCALLFWSGQAQTNFLAPSTQKMAERLARIDRNVNPLANQFQNTRKAIYYAEALKRETDLVKRLDLQRLYSIELLNAGRTEEAAKEFARFEEMLLKNNTPFLEKNKEIIRLYQATAALRLGEQENCLLLPSAESCIFPIRGGGIHQLQRGSRGAIGILTNLLTEKPNSMAGRWLLNIASMTVGDYPAKVPPQWLIAPKFFESEYPLPRFTNIAEMAGLDIEKLSGGSVVEDFDNDGLLDVMTTSMGLRDQMRLFHNNGDGTFTDITEKAGLTGLTGGLNMVQADYNNDGFVDVLVLRGAWMGQEGRHPNSLLRNNGDGTFTDVTEEAGLLSFHPTQTAVWFDFNGDGFLDLFIGNESLPQSRHRCELYRNNRDGTFTEVAEEAGLGVYGFVKGVAAGDFDNDGRPDLYLSLRGQPNHLFHNDGPPAGSKDPKSVWHFSDVTETAGVREPIQSFPCWFFDYDNDGWEDIFVCGYYIKGIDDVALDYMGMTNIGTTPRLYHNLGNGKFEDVTKKVHLDRVLHGMGANYGDLDNDGWLDFYIGTGDPDLWTLLPKRMLRNAGGKVFQDVTTAGGFGHLQKGHGISFADINNDGQQEVFENMGGAYSGDVARNALYLNPGTTNDWITLKLIGTKSNRSAIGARIKVNVTSPEGKRSIFRTVRSGASFGCNPLRQEIGLGPQARIDSIEINWPTSGIKQEFKNVTSRQFYEIKEDSAQLTKLAVKSFQFGKMAPSAGHMHKASQ